MNAEIPASAQPSGIFHLTSLKLRRRIVVALAALAALVACGWIFRTEVLFGLGHYLTSAEAPTKADLVVVLGGDLRGNRILKGAELVREGYAPRVLVSGMAYLYGSHESDRAIEFAVQHGFPREIFVPMHDDVYSTVEELTADVPVIHRFGAHSILLVTSAYHTRRAGEILRRAAPGLVVHTIAAPDPYWNNGYWWTSREGRKLWLYEALKSVADIFRV